MTLPSPDSVANYRLLLQSGLIHIRLDGSIKSVPVILTDLNEPEWLQSAGNRNQEFCCAKHQASLRSEHQFDRGVLMERARQAKQPARSGNDLQSSTHLLSTREAKDRHGAR